MSTTAPPIRVLCVDDDPDLASLTATFLEREDDRIEVVTAADAEAGMDELGGREIDCVVSDYDMPGPSGIEFLESVREVYPDLPFVLFTGKGSEEIASRAISAGVTDYLEKGSGTDQYAVLANRVANAVERYRAERDADRTRAHLTAIAENTNDAIVTIDEGSTIRFANPAVYDLFGYRPADLEGEPLSTLIPERYRDAHREAFDRYLETGEPTIDWRDVEFPGRRADGGEIPLSISFSEFEIEGERRFTGIIRDVSERARMEERLREREERFRQLAENLGEVVWMSDPEKEEILYVNPAYEEVWGRSREDLYADPRSFLDAIHPEDRDRVEAALEGQSRGEYDEEYRVVRPDGEVRRVRDRAVPVRDDAGEVYRIIGIASDVTDRVGRERELERRGARFEHLQRFAGIGYWELDPRSDPPYDVMITGELYRIHALPPGEDLDLEKGIEFYHPEDRPAIERAVERAIDDGEPYDIEARLISADGDLRWVHTVCEPIEEDGEVVLLRGVLQDITERKKREQELERTIDRMTDAIVRVDSEWRFTFVDGRAEEIYNMDADDLLGRDFWDVFSEALGTRFEEEYRRAMETREPVSLEEYFGGLDGWFQVDVYPDDGGGLSFYFRDVTDRVGRERELELRTALLEAQAETTIDGLLVVDEDRDIIQHNERFLDIWGFDEELVEGSRDDPLVLDHALERVEDPDAFLERVEYLYNHPEEESRDEFRLADGRWIDRYSAPVLDEDGRYYGRLWAFRDVTERIEHERELEQHKERLEEFASIVSHDLRNPLNVAEGQLELAREDPGGDHLDAVEDAHDRMRALIEDLLTLARANESMADPEPVDLAALAEACWRNVETGEADLRVETDRVVMADESRLAQLLENLIRNSIEHGGEDVTVTVGDADSGFYVADDGPGIPEEGRGEVFESGYSTSPEGTGFGLSIVETIADAHGWDVTATGAEGGGARFEITGVTFA